MSQMEDLTLDLSNLVAMASQDPQDLKPLLDYGLEWMMRLGSFDLVAIFLIEDDNLVVKAARGALAQRPVFSHSVSLKQFPSIRESLQSCGPRIFSEDDHSGDEGDLFDGVLDFPHGHACMVIPMCHGGEAQGIVSFDRAQCGAYEEQTIHLLEIYTRILGMAIHQAEQSRMLAQLHHESRERERLLVEEQREAGMLSPLASSCPEVRALGETLMRVAPAGAPVLITGETGAGKEGVVQLIHENSPRHKEPFVKINCAAIPGELLESELFGVVRGAFTGATRDRLGRIRMANRGTLFLDEIGEMPQALQAKLLRVLQEGTFEPVGSDTTIKVDVRVVAATNADLNQAIAEKRFRSDLYYRLSVVELHLPPLRRRLEDLPALCEVLLQRIGLRLGRNDLRMADEALERLTEHDWPGNIRELANLLERAAILTRDPVLRPVHLDLPVENGGEPQVHVETELGPPLTLDEAQRRHIIKVLRQANGKVYGEDGAAALLDIKPSTLQSRMKKLGIERKTEFC